MYEGNIKQSLITDRNPIELMALRYIQPNSKVGVIQNSNFKSSWWLPAPETNIKLGLSDGSSGNIGDHDFLTVSVNSKCQNPFFVVNAYYVKLPEGVEYVGGGRSENFAVWKLGMGQSHDFPFHLGRVWGPCTVLCWWDARFIDSDYSDIRQPTIKYISSGYKEIFGKSSMVVIGGTYPWDANTNSVCKFIR